MILNSIQMKLLSNQYNMYMVSPPVGDGRNWQPGRASTVSSSEIPGWSELQLCAVWVTPGSQHGHRTALYGRRQVSLWAEAGEFMGGGR